MDRQSPPPPGRDGGGPWPGQPGRPQGRPEGRAQGGRPPARQYGPPNPTGRQGPPRPTAERPTSDRQPPERPTTLIPKVDETSYIPKVEGAGADGFPTTDPDEYQPRHGSFSEPKQPPKPPLRPAQPAPPTQQVPPVPKPGPQGPNGTNGMHGPTTPNGIPVGNGMPPGGPPGPMGAGGPGGADINSRLGGFTGSDNDRTDYFGTDLTSQFAQEFDQDRRRGRGGNGTGNNGNFAENYGDDNNYGDNYGDDNYGAGHNYRDDSYGDDYEPGYGGEDSFADQPPVAPPRERGRTTLRTMGEVLITAGMVVLLFVVYELYVTDIFSAQKQASATTALNKEWDTVGAGPARTNHYDLTDGSGIAKLYIPAFGQDYVFTVIEGTSPADLAIGPGHYPGSALPGQPGDFAVAGHRVGEGAPFDDLGLLSSCDSILIENQTDWYVYRVLPMSGEVSGWAGGQGKTAQCAGPNGEAPVQPLGGLYAQTVGREIVLPTEGDVVAPVPHHPGAQVSAGQQAALLTLTTCNPKFSAAQRMIIHAILVKDWKKDAGNPDKMPPEMKETS